jgi:hypothetical protein
MMEPFLAGLMPSKDGDDSARSHIEHHVKARFHC